MIYDIITDSMISSLTGPDLKWFNFKVQRCSEFNVHSISKVFMNSAHNTHTQVTRHNSQQSLQLLMISRTSHVSHGVRCDRPER